MSKKKKNKSNRSPQARNTIISKSENKTEAAKNNVPEETAPVEDNSESKVAEEKPSEETTPVEDNSENKAAEEKPSEETVPVEDNSEDKAAEEKPSAETAPVEDNSEDKAAEEKPSEETVPVEDNSESKAAEEKPSGKTAPVEENAEDNTELPKAADRNAEKLKSVKKQRFYFAFAIVVFLFAAIGVVSSVVFVVNSIKSSVSNDPLKDEFTKFLLPVAGNDVAPFENYDELSNYSKINCSIWNILLNHDTSNYNLSETGEFIISEYDVEFACKEIFGSSESIIHRSVGATDMSFVYDSEKHVYSCRKDLRYLSYVPVITEMTESGGRYTLTVEYYLPAMLFLSENMGLETEAEKTMKYIIDRNDGKNTLVAVQFTSEDIY